MKYERVQIDALGYELPPVVVSSAELEDRLLPMYETLHIQPGQLETLSGIVERRFWEPGYPVSEGAIAAARKALKKSGVPSTAVEALIYGGVCRDDFEPATACHVAAALERDGHALHPAATVFDLSNACLGVLNGMLEVANRIELGQIRAGMVVSCESARDIVDATIERMLETRDMDVFRLGIATMTGGSGAIAVLLTDGSFDSDSNHRLVGGVTRAAPQHHRLCRWGMVEKPPNGSTSARTAYHQVMSTDSVAVLEHGVDLGKDTWIAFLGELSWDASHIDRFVSHQVGSTHRESILGALGIPSDRDFVAYDYLGNTGTVALPLALALADERGFVEAGHRIGLLGIGSGLNCLMLGAQW